MRRLIPLVVVLATPAPAAAADWVDKVVVGALVQDRSPYADRHEGGLALNLELVFAKPGWAAAPWLPAPVVGADISLDGETSYVHAGLGWEVDVLPRVFVGAGVGLAVHNGEKTKTAAECARDDCGFGSRFTLRLAGELGWRLDERDAVSLYLDHISHAGWFGDQNEGVDNIGLRWHRKI